MPETISAFLRTLTPEELSKLKLHWIHAEQKRRLDAEPPLPVVDLFKPKEPK